MTDLEVPRDARFGRLRCEDRVVLFVLAQVRVDERGAQLGWFAESVAAGVVAEGPTGARLFALSGE